MYALLLDIKGESRESFSAAAVSQLLSAQNNLYAKVAYLGWHILIPFSTPVRVWTLEKKSIEVEFQFPHTVAL